MNFTSKTIGLNFPSPVNFDRQLARGLSTGAFAFIYFGVSVFLGWPDLEKIIQALVTLTFCFQVMVRFVLYLVNGDHCYMLHQTIKKFYKDCESMESSRKVSLLKQIKNISGVAMFLFIFHAICMFFPFCVSLFNFIVMDVKYTPFAAFLPYVDSNTDFGYFVNLFAQLYITCVEYMGHPSFDFSYFIVATHLKPVVDIFEWEMKDLELLVVKSADIKTIKQKLMKLVDMHLEMIQYNRAMMKYVGSQFFIILVVSVAVVCSSGITILTSKYSIALGTFLLCVFQISYVCIIGTFIRHHHQRLNDALWQFEWFKLPLHLQKDFLMILVNVQQPIQIDLLFLKVVDMELFTDVSKKLSFT